MAYQWWTFKRWINGVPMVDLYNLTNKSHCTHNAPLITLPRLFFFLVLRNDTQPITLLYITYDSRITIKKKKKKIHVNPWMLNINNMGKLYKPLFKAKFHMCIITLPQDLVKMSTNRGTGPWCLSPPPPSHPVIDLLAVNPNPWRCHQWRPCSLMAAVQFSVIIHAFWGQ